jgi:hypothetical protein
MAAPKGRALSQREVSPRANSPETLDGVPIPEHVGGLPVRIGERKSYKTLVPKNVAKYLDGDGG